MAGGAHGVAHERVSRTIRDTDSVGHDIAASRTLRRACSIAPVALRVAVVALNALGEGVEGALGDACQSWAWRNDILVVGASRCACPVLAYVGAATRTCSRATAATLSVAILACLAS